MEYKREIISTIISYPNVKDTRRSTKNRYISLYFTIKLRALEEMLDIGLIHISNMYQIHFFLGLAVYGAFDFLLLGLSFYIVLSLCHWSLHILN